MQRSLVSLLILLLKPKKFEIISLFLLIAVIGSVPALDSYLIKNLLDFIEQYEHNLGEEFIYKMMVWSVCYALWWELINWMWRLYDYLYLRSLPDLKAYTLDYYYSHVQLHSQRFFQNSLSGFITNRIVDASRSLELIFSSVSEKIVRKLFTLAAALFTLYNVNPVFSTVFVVWLTIFFGISAFCSTKIRTLSMNWARNRSIIAGKIVDAIGNISSIRMYNNFEYERNYLHKYFKNMVDSEVILNWFMFKLRYVQGLSCSIMIFGMLYYLGSLRATGQISIGDFALVITLCLAVADDIWDFTQDLGDFFEEIGSFSQSIDLLNPHSITDSENPKLLSVPNGKIEFKDVSFKYKHSDNIFENKNVIIEPKQKVGLVGFSGSGKSTFINLITRMYDIDSGAILIDSQDISKITQNSLRDNICVIPQEPILFNRSIIDNIRYGKKNASDTEVFEAAKRAHIHEDILKLSDGYNSPCGEKGSALSGGQRQRVAIARAILKDAPILILDEATSALDSITEKLIQESLDYLMQHKTVLVIAHRLSTLKHMNRILVFNKGSIIEDGTHFKLIKKNGLYKKLWESQVGGFISDETQD